MTDTVVTIEKYAKHRCPVDTGKLPRFDCGRGQGIVEEGSVGTTPNTPWRSSYGSRPHDIKPR
jgi:hypothetical protein